MADSLFPTASQGVTISATTTTDVPFGRSWSFDFSSGEFVTTTSNKMMITRDIDAWVEWCQKAVFTERYKYLIYSRGYGHDMTDVIGSDLSRSAAESEIQRMVKECLMVDPRTKDVLDFTFSGDGDEVFFTCTIVSIRDETVQITGNVVST